MTTVAGSRVRRFVASVGRRGLSVLRPPTTKTMSFADEDNAEDVAMLSLTKSGWYNMSTKELAPGFEITEADIVVDVGCGSGGASLFAARQGAEVVGIDIDPSSIELLSRRMDDELRQRGEAKSRPCRAVASDCNPIPLPADYATTVLAMEVLEHVDEPSEFLAELVRIGKPGARYFLSVPDALGESVQRKIAPSAYWAKPNHIRVFERDEFQNVVEAAGLMVERRFYYGFYWSMWWFLFWGVRGADIPFGKSGGTALLRNWNKTWKCLLNSPHAEHVWKALEEAVPKSQVIVARKPAN